MDNLFNENTPQQIDPNKDYFVDLVGEGKKYKDQQALARAVVEKENFIVQVLDEKRGMETELATRLNQEAFLDQLKALQKPTVDPNAGNPPAQDNASNVLSEEQLQERVRKIYEDEQKKNFAAANRAIVHKKLTEALGEGYAVHVKAKAAELGVSVKFLEDAASTNPNVVFELLGVNRPVSPTVNPGLPPTQLNAVGAPSLGNVRNKKYYDAMRKADPKKYHSAQNYVEMHNEALKQGASFFE